MQQQQQGNQQGNQQPAADPFAGLTEEEWDRIIEQVLAQDEYAEFREPSVTHEDSHEDSVVDVNAPHGEEAKLVVPSYDALAPLSEREN
jgi:cytochrome c-type biogenesis protein CcmH/NrfG